MPSERLNDYIEWTGMNHAFSAYQEGEDFEYLTEQELNLSPEEYRKITPKRLEMLDHLTGTPANSINELAQNIGRDVKNVYHDLMFLAKLGFVNLHREGRNIKPELLVREITLLLG
jgi:predicted transcriptional regulator